MLVKKSSFPLEDVSQAPQQCEIEKILFESVGLDYLYHVNDFNKERFNAFMGQFSSTKLRKEITSKSYLREYKNYLAESFIW
jgi:hypothetical protein